jgi:site-specific DNA-adenine methylase
LIELFGGSAAVTLTNILHNHSAKPVRALVNDSDCLLANLWRAIQNADPNKLARHCRQNYSEIDLIAWHCHLGKMREAFRTELENDVAYCDLKIAGRTLWAYRGWIGGGFADPDVKVNKKMPRAVISNWIGGSPETHIAFFQKALENVQIFCGDWKRALSRTQTELFGVIAMVFDPPYPPVSCAKSYAHHGGLVAAESRYKAIELGEKPNYRIAYCGYFDLHDQYFPPTWERLRWKSAGGYGNQARSGRGRFNSGQETVWFSPFCLRPTE